MAGKQFELTKQTRWQYIMGCMEAHKQNKERFEKRIVEILEKEIEPKTVCLKEVVNG